MKQYLVFVIDNHYYAIKASCVKEIVEYSGYTRVPMMQSFILGVTNIRGNIIPLIDLKNRFGFEKSNIGKKSSVIVVKQKVEDEEMQIGFLIDEVYEVEEIDDKDVKQAPDFGLKIDRRFVEEMIKFENDFIPVLNLENVLNIEELSKIEE